ncbi:tRNA-dihydrouridine synthase [Chloroflexota bacterium]
MKLFEPITIRGMELRNRIVYPAIQMNMGLANRRARAFYAERTRGGTGLLITAGVAIDYLASEEVWDGTEGLASFVERLHLLTDQVHEAGGKIGVQLWQGNRFPAGRGDARLQQPLGTETAWRGVTLNSGDRVAPSPREDMRELTIPEIEAIIYRFAKASRNVREAGFDCVEIHGAHGYLPCQFTIQEWNQRTDKYGGDLAGRMKFGTDLVAAVRAFVGPDFPILFRLGVLRANRSTHPDSITFARELEKTGVDCLNVSVSTVGSAIPGSPTKRYKMGTWVFLAEPIKKKVSVPVITVGRINTAEVAEDILSKGRADMVAIGRQLITDPFWPKKVLEGRSNEIVACESCNINCYAPTRKRRLPEGAPLCKINERVGREWEIPAPE